MGKENQMKKGIITFLKEPLIYVILICILFQIKIYKSVPEYVMTPDSTTYIQYTQNIFEGQVNSSRTPVYPYFIKAIKKIGGEEFLGRNVTMMQKLLFIATLILFYYTLKMVTKNKLVLTFFTLLFGICPYIILWNVTILTEALSLFEMVGLAFITLWYLKRPNPILAGSIGLVVFIMIMTRPSFIYLLPIYLFFWILRFFLNRKERMNNLIGTGSCLLCTLLLLGFCGLMKAQYGEFSLTAISYVNQLISAVDSDAYHSANNPEMIQIVDEVTGDRTEEKASWDAYNALKDVYSVKQLKEFASSSIMNSPNYKNYIINKTIRIGYLDIGTNYVEHKDFANDLSNSSKNYKYLGHLLLPINFAIVYILIGIAIIYLIWYVIKYKKINWEVAFLTVMILANLATLIIGAPFEPERLFLASIPCVLLLIAYPIRRKE